MDIWILDGFLSSSSQNKNSAFLAATITTLNKNQTSLTTTENEKFSLCTSFLAESWITDPRK
jgi:hypothetical protein